MQGDETQFSSTYSVSLNPTSLQAHTGHFAIRKDVVVPDDVSDDFRKEPTRLLCTAMSRIYMDGKWHMVARFHEEHFWGAMLVSGRVVQGSYYLVI